MFIPPKKYAREVAARSLTGDSALSMRNDHIYIPSDLVVSLFGDAENVSVVYYPDRRSLLIARSDDETFKALHKTKQYMLKSVNLEGDKSIAIQDILIDNDLPGHPRTLAHEAHEALGTVNVVL